MNWLLISIGGGFALFVLLIVFFVVLSRKQYRYEALIIAEVGGSDVLIRDKAKAYQTDDGYWAVVFQHQRDTMVKSPPYKFWTLFSSPKVAEDMLSDGQKGYDRGEVMSMLNRGLIMKKVGEGDMKPVRINQDKDLEVIDQDDLAFKVSSTRDREEVKKNKWGTYAPYVVFGATVLISGLLFVFAFIYLNMTLAENIDAICSGASNAARTATNSTSFLPGVGA